jgi:hypothetical protein
MAPTFIPLPGRDASHVIRGFLYQIQLTVLRWLELDASMSLELESGEDIDVLREAIITNNLERTLEQIKHRTRAVTLKSPEILGALINFLATRAQNPGASLRFRFITNSRAAMERRKRPGQTAPGLVIWGEVANADAWQDRTSALQIVRSLVLDAARPAKVKKLDWKATRDFFETVPDADLFEFIKSVEWSLENPAAPVLFERISQHLVDGGFIDATNAQAANDQLVAYVLKRLSSPGPKRLS